MTLKELKNWLKSAVFISSTYEHVGGNKYKTSIYEKDGQLYAINSCNDHPSEKWGEKGYIRGEYESPRPVTRKTRRVSYIEEYYE